MSDPTNEEFDDLAMLAQSIEPEDQVRHAPPPELWDRIRAGALDDAAPHVEPGVERQGAAASSSDAVINLADERTSRQAIPTADISATSHESRFSPRLLLAAAAALVAFVVIGSFAISSIGGEPTQVYAAEISNADLPEPFAGTASVTLEVDDEPQIEIDFETAVPTDEPVELWVLSADGTDIVSVGLVQAGDTTWDWPADLDPEEYPIVDLSIEPDDGDPTHSGRSILRGELTTS